MNHDPKPRPWLQPNLKSFAVAMVVVSVLGTHPAVAEDALHYFPAGSLHDVDGPAGGEHAVRLNDWFSDHLSAMGEPPLWETPNDTVSVRLLMLPSFDPSTMVRLDISSEGATLTFKQLTGAGGYEPGDVAVSLERQLTTEERDQVQGVLEDVIENMRPVETRSARLPWMLSGKPLCLDGTLVVLEISEAGDHWAQERHECDLPPDHVLRQFANILHGLSGEQLISPRISWER